MGLTFKGKRWQPGEVEHVTNTLLAVLSAGELARPWEIRKAKGTEIVHTWNPDVNALGFATEQAPPGTPLQTMPAQQLKAPARYVLSRADVPNLALSAPSAAVLCVSIKVFDHAVQHLPEIIDNNTITPDMLQRLRRDRDEQA